MWAEADGRSDVRSPLALSSAQFAPLIAAVLTAAARGCLSRTDNGAEQRSAAPRGSDNRTESAIPSSARSHAALTISSLATIASATSEPNLPSAHLKYCTV